MKPLRLEMEGIKSFKDRTVIDFAPLVATGLFGIFGNTGSGKSSILFAINLALYYDTTDDFKKTFINTKVKLAYTEFTFELQTNGERKTYTVRREFKNGVPSAYLYEVNGGVKTCIQEKSTEVTKAVISLTGLSYNEFKKCIALPQGEFSAFINAKKSERTKIISGLFSLEEYSEKLLVRARVRKNDLEKQYLDKQSRIEEYGDIGKESLEEKSLRVKSLKSEIATLEKETAVLQKTYEQDLKTYEINENFKAAESALKRLKEEKPLIEEKQKILSGYALFAELALENENILNEEEKQSKTIEKLQNLNKKLQNDKILLAAIDIETIQKEREALIKKNAALAGLSPTVSLLKAKALERKSKLDEYDGVKKQLAEALAEQSKLAEKNSLKSGGIKRLESYFLKGEYAENISYYEEKKLALKPYADSDLKAAVGKEIADRLDRYRELAANAPKDIADIDKLIGELSGGSFEAESLRLKIETERAKLENIRLEGVKIAGELKELEALVAAVTGELEYSAACLQTQKELAAAEDKKASAAERQKQLLETVSALEKEISELEGESKQRINGLERMKKSLGERLAKNGIEDAAGLVKYNIGEDGKGELERGIKRHTDGLAAAEADYQKYSSGRDVKITGEHIAELKSGIAGAQFRLRELSSAAALGESELKSAEELLKKRDALVKEYESIGKKLSTAESLLKILTGRSDDRFIDFVAEEYIRDTAESASLLLLDLTSGRYSLKFERLGGASDFYVSDNLDGGNLRSVDTLSGGETFLVSLSLAVSLSESIYKKSLRPMEFFFLDEGFGTLDENLIDVVLNSLEKLKHTHFAIGLISHVQELKERINAKILVTAADENNGSRVDIIY